AHGFGRAYRPTHGGRRREPAYRQGNPRHAAAFHLHHEPSGKSRAMTPSRRSRLTRLLPSVVALGAVVLVLKTSDLVRDAYAQADHKVAALTSDPVPSNKDYAGGEDDQVASA